VRGYTDVYSTTDAFAVLKAKGLIKAWGKPDSGGADAPTGKGYTKIYSNPYAPLPVGTLGAFLPPKYGNPHVLIEPLRVRAAKGLIETWGDLEYGGKNAPNAPNGSGHTKIYSTTSAFAALTRDGSIKAWGNPHSGGAGAPSGSGYTKIYSNRKAFNLGVSTTIGCIRCVFASIL
jgi:hypothetical protein